MFRVSTPFRRGYRLHGAFETGEPRFVDNDSPVWAFFPPTMHLRGTIIGWGRIEPGSMRLAGDRISWVKIIRGRPVLRRATPR